MSDVPSPGHVHIICNLLANNKRQNLREWNSIHSHKVSQSCAHVTTSILSSVIYLSHTFTNTYTRTLLYLYSEEYHKQACLADTGHWTETLDAVLKRDTRRVSKLISCVGYTNSSAVQLEAIHLTQFFAARQPNLVDTLVQQKLTAGENS